MRFSGENGPRDKLSGRALGKVARFHHRHSGAAERPSPESMTAIGAERFEIVLLRQQLWIPGPRALPSFRDAGG